MKKSAFSLICLLIISALLLLSVEVAISSDHDCSGDMCEICAGISFADNVIKTSALLLFVLIPFFELERSKKTSRNLFSERDRAKITPVSKWDVITD